MSENGCTSVELWSSASFHEEAAAWVADVAESRGVVLTGPWSQPHCRPWSSVLRFESTSGPVWFKVNGPGTRHEPDLVVTLGKLAPDLVPQAIGVDAHRGWSLARDAGPVLRAIAAPDRLWSIWERLVRRYAEWQIRLADDVRTLTRTGVVELSPQTLPQTARRILRDLAVLPPENGGLTVQEVQEVEERLPTYDAWCADLAGSGIPSSIQHDDLHSANVCWTGSAETVRIIDWGDASVGHPFGTMLCTLNSIAHHAGCEVDDPRVARVRDAYLEPFASYAPHKDLLRYVDLARRTGCIARARAYQAALEGEPASTHAEYDFPVREWFLDLLSD